MLLGQKGRGRSRQIFGKVYLYAKSPKGDFRPEKDKKVTNRLRDNIYIYLSTNFILFILF